MKSRYWRIFLLTMPVAGSKLFHAASIKSGWPITGAEGTHADRYRSNGAKGGKRSKASSNLPVWSVFRFTHARTENNVDAFIQVVSATLVQDDTFTKNRMYDLIYVVPPSTLKIARKPQQQPKKYAAFFYFIILYRCMRMEMSVWQIRYIGIRYASLSLNWK